MKSSKKAVKVKEAKRLTLVKEEKKKECILQKEEFMNVMKSMVKKLCVDHNKTFEMVCNLLEDKDFVKKFKASKDTDVVELRRDGSYRIYQGAIVEGGVYKMIIDQLFWGDPRILSREFCVDFPDRAKCENLTDSMYCNDFFQQLGQNLTNTTNILNLAIILTDLVYPENKTSDVSTMS